MLINTKQSRIILPDTIWSIGRALQDVASYELRLNIFPMIDSSLFNTIAMVSSFERTLCE